MSQLQTTRNEYITVCETEIKLISGSLKLKNISFRPEVKTHVNGLLVNGNLVTLRELINARS